MARNQNKNVLKLPTPAVQLTASPSAAHLVWVTLDRLRILDEVHHLSGVRWVDVREKLRLRVEAAPLSRRHESRQLRQMVHRVEADAEPS